MSNTSLPSRFSCICIFVPVVWRFQYKSMKSQICHLPPGILCFWCWWSVRVGVVPACVLSVLWIVSQCLIFSSSSSAIANVTDSTDSTDSSSAIAMTQVWDIAVGKATFWIVFAGRKSNGSCLLRGERLTCRQEWYASSTQFPIRSWVPMYACCVVHSVVTTCCLGGRAIRAISARSWKRLTLFFFF